MHQLNKQLPSSARQAQTLSCHCSNSRLFLPDRAGGTDAIREGLPTLCNTHFHKLQKKKESPTPKPETSGCRQKAFSSGRDFYLTEEVLAAPIPGSAVTPQVYEARQDKGYPRILTLRLGRCFAKQTA